jgi:hypothetical protein
MGNQGSGSVARVPSGSSALGRGRALSMSTNGRVRRAAHGALVTMLAFFSCAAISSPSAGAVDATAAITPAVGLPDAPVTASGQAFLSGSKVTDRCDVV